MARLKIEWLPAVGAARYEVREQGGGDTPIDRYRSGTPLGPRVDKNSFDFEVPIPRVYHLSVRSYNRAGVGSPEPQEITATPGTEGDGVWVPSDVNLAMYISMDEKFDQTGAEMTPQLWNTSGGPTVADPGTAEHGRRMRYDQGFAGNHMILQQDPSLGGPTPPGSGGQQRTFATGVKPGICNHHIEMGDVVSGLDADRAQSFFSEQFLVVDERVSKDTAQTDVDLVENFTLVGWVNPCMLWLFGDSYGESNGQRYPIWARYGVAGGNIGWWFILGGPPFYGTDPDLKTGASVNGLSFCYLKEGSTHMTTNPGGASFFWAYDWHYEKDPFDRGDSFPGSAGEYPGWTFAALVVEAANNGLQNFTCWAGRADRGDLRNLGTFSGTKIDTTMWARTNADRIMCAINHGTESNTAVTAYETMSNLGLYCKYDEMRIYNRVLAEPEIRGLYYHPGGQKRTENPMELERQV